MTHSRLSMVLVFGMVAAGCGRSADVFTTVPVGALPRVANAKYVPAGQVVEIIATDYAFEPSVIRVDPGTHQFVLRNQGTVLHDLAIGGQHVAHVEPGEFQEFSFDVTDPVLEMTCTIPGHLDLGMKGRIGTSEEALASVSPTTGGQVVTGPAPVEKDPNAPAYVLRDPVVPARGEGPGVTLVTGGAPNGGDLIEMDLVIEEKPMTVAEGFVQQVWTFGGSVPGPTIRAQVGDTVRVRLINPPTATVSHSIDFHASQVAWNDEMRSIDPGEELIYEFTTDYAGVWMYHCGTAPVLHHIANGMFGMIIVEPAGGLPPMENEFFIVQNEWYLGPQGQVSSLEKANQGAPSPDLMMFNGIGMQYLDNPIVVPTGEELRLFVLNVGPSMDSAFHIVGTIFDTVIKEGVPLERGNPGNWGSGVVDLAPAQGAVIELRAMEDGLYPIVTHAFNFPGRGALGLLQAGDGDPTGTGTTSTESHS